MNKTIKLLLFFLLVSGNLYSQWSSNPMENLRAISLNNTQLLPKIASSPDGGFYVSWFDGRGNGQLKAYLQRFDRFGVKQFGADGLLISDKPQNSWLGDYSLVTDGSNNAILVFSDKRASTMADTTVNPYAYKISPAGAFLWGPDGVALTGETSRYQMWPKAAVLTDGSVAFAWWYFFEPTKTSWVKIQRINSAGVPQYPSAISIQSPDGKRYQYPNIVASDAGNFIVSWVYGPKDTVGSFVPDNISVHCMKYNSAGTAVWGSTPKTVYSAMGNTVPIYMVPEVISDKNNGIVISFFHTTGLQNISSGIQRYSSDGTQIYPNNGVNLSTNSSRIHIEPFSAINPNNNDIYTFFVDADAATQDFQTVYGQRINSAGQRLWSDTGRAFGQLINSQVAYINCFNNGDTNVTVTYGQEVPGPIRDLIYGFRTGPSGVMQWGGSPVLMSSVVSFKDYINAAMNPQGMLVSTWQDTRFGMMGNGTIFVQNLKPDGTLGPVSIKQIGTNLPGKFDLSQNYPNPFNPTTKIKFDLNKSGLVTLKVYDNLGRVVNTLVNENLSAGVYEVNFNAENLSSGIYFYSITNGSEKITKSMLLVK